MKASPLKPDLRAITELPVKDPSPTLDTQNNQKASSGKKSKREKAPENHNHPRHKCKGGDHDDECSPLSGNKNESVLNIDRDEKNENADTIPKTDEADTNPDELISRLGPKISNRLQIIKPIGIDSEYDKQNNQGDRSSKPKKTQRRKKNKDASKITFQQTNMSEIESSIFGLSSRRPALSTLR